MFRARAGYLGSQNPRRIPKAMMTKNRSIKMRRGVFPFARLIALRQKSPSANMLSNGAVAA
jgi:hypothetical protein